MSKHLAGQDSTPDSLELGSRLVLAGMEIARLQKELKKQQAQAQGLPILAREKEVMRAKLTQLELQEKVFLQEKQANLKLTKEVIGLKEVLKIKDSRISQLTTDLHIYKLSHDSTESTATFQQSLLKTIDELRGKLSAVQADQLQSKTLQEDLSMLRVENAKLERMLVDATSSNLSKPDQDRTSTLIHSEMALRLCNLEDDNRNLRQRISELLAREAHQENVKNSAVDLHDKLRKLLEDSEEKQSIIFRLSEEADTLRSQAALAKKYQESTERLLQENQSIAEVLSEVRDKLKPDGDLQAAQTQNQELRTMLDTLRADLDRTQRNYRELNDRHKALQSSYASKSAEASQIEVLVAENQRLSEGFGELRGLHSLLTREKEQLQSELSNYMQSYSEQTSDLQNRCFNAENLVKTLKSRIEELMAANTALVKELEMSSSRNKTVAELEDRLRVSEAERDSLRRVCDDLKAHHNAASSELGDLKKNSIRFIGLEQQFASQSQELRTLRSLTESQEAKSKSLQQQVYVLDTELAQVKRDKSMLEKLCQEQSSSITELQKLKEHKTQAASQEFTIKELEQKVLTLTNQIRGLVDANSELRAKLQGTLPASNQHHLDNLPLEDSNKLRCLLQQLDTEHTLSKQRELELKSTVASLEGKIRAFESSEGDLMRTRHDNIALRAEIEDVRFENKRLKADLMQERTQNTNLKNIHSEVKMIEVDLSAKEIALQDAYKKIQLLEGDLSRNTTESKHRHNSIQDNHAKLLEENSHLKQMLDKQKQELNQIYEKLSLLSSLELNHKDASEELKLVKEQNAELTQQLDRQQNERQAMLQKFDLRLKQIESDRTGSIQTEGVLREELQALRTQTHQASDELVSLRIKEKRLLAAEDEIKQLQQENFHLRKQIVQDLKQSPPTEPTETEKLKTEVEALRVRVNELVRLLDELRNYNLELETANRSIPTLNAQLELLQSRIGEKESAIKNLSTQLQQQGTEGGLGVSQSESNKRRSHEEFLQGLVEENNHRIGGLEVLLEEEKKAHRQTKREVALLSEELERCRTLAQEVKDLRRAHAELEEQALRCAGELELIKDAKEHCDREIEGLASKNVLLMGALQQSDASDSQLKLAMAEAQRLADKVQLLTSVKTEQESVIENQERELAEKRNQIVELETILEALDHRCSTLQQEANDVRTDRETLLSKIRQLEQVFTTEANSAERNTHDLTSQNHLLRDRLQSVGDSLQMTQQENRFLMEEVQTARQQLDQAQKERSEAMTLLLRAQKELELHGHISKMVQHSDLSLLQDRIALLTEERDLLQAQAEHQQEDLRSKGQDIAMLKSKLSECLQVMEVLQNPQRSAEQRGHGEVAPDFEDLDWRHNR